MSSRYQSYVRERYQILLGYLGGLIAIIGVVLLLPLIVIPFYWDERIYALQFLIAGLPVLLTGVMLRWRFKSDDGFSPDLQEGMVTIVITWIIAIVVGAVPFILISGLTFHQAIFESTSGWTTTGLSVVDVTMSPHIILFYRSLLQLVGGAGFAIIVLSSITGPVGAGLSSAEGRDDQLAPNIRNSAEIVLTIYIVYMVGGTIALFIAGMDAFDAVNHAFAAISTGGFSTHTDSIGYFDSIVIEGVIIVLMLLGSTNFLTAWILIKGKFKAFSKNSEIHLVALIIPISFLLILFGTTIPLYESVGEATRITLFEVISALSTTGFSTVGYTDWSQSGWMVLILIMLIGGGSGSTSGGIKQLRIYVLAKALYWEIRKAFLPRHTVNVPLMWRREQAQTLTNDQIRRSALYIFFYMILFFTIVLITLFHGNFSIGHALFETASAISTVGLSIGLTSADNPPSLLWVYSLGMLLGRLEFYALFIGIIKLGADMVAIVSPQSK